MIPGFVISWITFPGVIVHELAHALFCRLFGIGIYEIKYFQLTTSFRAPTGYVVHEPAKHAWQNVVVAIGPLVVNTILGAIIAAPAAIPALHFESVDVVNGFLLWLGVSIAMHSFPSTGDAALIWRTISSKGTPLWTKVIGMPLIGLIYVGALGSMLWLDLLYGLAVAGLLPNLLIKWLA